MKVFSTVILVMLFVVPAFMAESALSEDGIKAQRPSHQQEQRDDRQIQRQVHQDERQEALRKRRQVLQERRQEAKEAGQNLPAVRSPASLESNNHKKKRRRIRRHKRDN